jgi:hypothetical protein
MKIMSHYFEIRIKGRLPEEWSEWFDSLEISYEDSNTILSGNVTDQSSLHGILNQIRNLNIELISVNPENTKDKKS